MSAGTLSTDLETRPIRRLNLLAPRFREAVEKALAECNGRNNRLQALVYETYRSNALQALYYQRGRTVRPPSTPVTNASNNLFSWHGYGLAVDVIHAEKLWSPGNAWFERVASIFIRHGCRWGGEWKEARDLPHFQWGRCKPSPSDKARELWASGGTPAVWRAVGAGN
jgi:peptidoglycan LD-endopeptidase CwlK